MKKILHLISSPRGEESFSIRLGNAIIEKLTAVYPGSVVKTRNLVTDAVPHLGLEHLTSFFTPVDQHTEADKTAAVHSDRVIEELFEADIIVIGAPLYNFSVPSALKAWIDHVARTQFTFSVTENGLVGLVTGKKVYIAASSGGFYSEGPAAASDFSVPYLKRALAFLGITDVEVYRAEGTAYPDSAGTALEKAVSAIQISGTEAVA